MFEERYRHISTTFYIHMSSCLLLKEEQSLTSKTKNETSLYFIEIYICYCVYIVCGLVYSFTCTVVVLRDSCPPLAFFVLCILLISDLILVAWFHSLFFFHLKNNYFFKKIIIPPTHPLRLIQMLKNYPFFD